MTRASRMLCACSLLVWGLAGCAGMDSLSLFLQSTSTGRDRVLAGSPQSVSLAVQATLNQLGMTAVANEQAGVIRISSATRTGQRFLVVLTRVEKEQSERTRIRFEWENGSDDQIGIEILSQLETHMHS